jgi:acyl carrier protein
MHDVAKILKSILVDEMGLGLDAAQITETTPLLEGGLDLDSVLIVELIGLIEHRFGFRFEDADLRTSSFQTLAILAGIVRKRISGTRGT